VHLRAKIRAATSNANKKGKMRHESENNYKLKEAWDSEKGQWKEKREWRGKQTRQKG
jgi:hypothetical protein